MTRSTTAGDSRGPRRSPSLRREWSRAFVLLFLLQAAVAVAAILGMRGVVGTVDATARRLRSETLTIEALSAEVVAHEEVGHKILSNERVDRAAYLSEQRAIVAAFVAAERHFPVADGLRATVAAADRSWRAGLMTYGLWGGELAHLQGNHSAENPVYGASSDHTVALLTGLGSLSLGEMSRELHHGEGLELAITLALGGAFVVLLGTLVYYRRRMDRHLVRPVADLHAGVKRLQSGDFDHRMDVVRRDELGELGGAFNEMADALHASHLSLTEQATHDPLTGLANRTMLVDRLVRPAGPDGERRARQESVVFIDVDDFKTANDALGHDGGDQLLVEVANHLRGCVRPHDMVCRLGGDEFAIVVAEDEEGMTASEIAARVMAALRRPLDIGGTRVEVGVSIGIASRDTGSGDPAELMKSADFAMYEAKRAGKGQTAVFDAAMRDELAARTALRSDLDGAIAAGELRLDYQPVVDLATGTILGVEALVRWAHPTRGTLLPRDFVDLAEESGAIDSLGAWVLESAIRDAASWRRLTPCPQLWVSVHVSRRQLASPEGMARVRLLVEEASGVPGGVVLELSEEALLGGGAGGVAAVGALRTAGARIAVDDFGAGVSPLRSYASLAIDIVKIDRSFVSGVDPAVASGPMLAGIISIASAITDKIVAKGIETPEQLEVLRCLDCPMGQGFLLARPLPAAALEQLLLAGGVLQ